MRSQGKRKTKFERGGGGGSVHFEAFRAVVTRALSMDPKLPVVERKTVGFGLLFMRSSHKPGLKNELKPRGRAVVRLHRREKWRAL